MKFFNDPLEFILNCFKLTMKHRPSLLALNILDFTHSSWMKDRINQNNLHCYYNRK